MQVNIELPAELEAVYANFALITHSPSEVIVDFARLLPGQPKGAGLRAHRDDADERQEPVQGPGRQPGGL